MPSTYLVNFRGFSACPCLAEWLPAYEAELHRRGLLDGQLRIYQLIGSYSGSSGTHSEGGAFDLLDLPGELDQWVARQMGADATWARPYNWDGDGGIRHTHGVLRGCPHNGPARYQIESPDFGVDHGHNGLANGGPDDGPRPLSGRTWREGIKWAREQGDDMPPYSEWKQADKDDLAADVQAAVAAELDKTAETTKGKRSLRQQVKETFQK